MSSSKLTQQAISGLGWQGSVVVSNILIRAAVFIILARTLTPTEFGIVAAAMVVAHIVKEVSQLGVARALVQRLELSRAHLQGGMAIAIYTGIAATLAVYLSAPAIAELFEIAGLQPFVEVLSAILLFSSLGAVPAAMLQRERRFRELSICDFVSFVIGFAGVALTLAFLGMGAWALALANVAQAGVRMIMLFWIYRVHPYLELRLPIARDLLGIGAGFSVGQAGNFVATQVDYVIVGRALGAEALGFYNRAYQLLMLPAQLVGNAASTVLIPTVASIQDQRDRVGRAFLRAMGLVSLIAWPVSGVSLIVAPELIRTLLGERWDPMILPFQILVVTLLFRTTHKICDAVVQAMGAMYARAWRQWLYAALVALGAYTGLAYGIAGVAAGVSVAVLVNYLLMLQLGCKLGGIGLGEAMLVQIRHLLPGLLIALPAGAATIAGRIGAWPEMGTLSLALAGSALATAGLMRFAAPMFGPELEWLFERAKERLAKSNVESQ
ncbi:lipopolysaccharide biosynthesis protein [Altererythrobacter sp. MF3-039]|uniref:lipopolysaccharide biosynthesis protein n=1 Tax=Altererythrobacter sp. MF3-039 TaxID=3252901 RepID=UPI00390CB942